MSAPSLQTSLADIKIPLKMFDNNKVQWDEKVYKRWICIRSFRSEKETKTIKNGKEMKKKSNFSLKTFQIGCLKACLPQWKFVGFCTTTSTFELWDN